MKYDINSIVLAVREVSKEHWDNFPVSCCFEASLLLEKVTSNLGHNSYTYEGLYNPRGIIKNRGCEHYWNKIDGEMFDITADQFGDAYGTIQDTSKYSGRQFNIDKCIIDAKENDEDSGEDIEENELLSELNCTVSTVNKLVKEVYCYLEGGTNVYT